MSAFRDELADCPRCGKPLDPGADRVNCEHCKGVLIEDKHVLQVVVDTIKQPLDALPLDDRTAKEPNLICPACRNPMAPHMLYGIAVDRCATHGLWFDGQELEQMMEKVQRDTREGFTTPQKVIGGVYLAAFIALNIIRFLSF